MLMHHPCAKNASTNRTQHVPPTGNEYPMREVSPGCAHAPAH